MDEKKKQPAWRKFLYQPKPPSLNLSDITPEEADAQEEARIARAEAHAAAKAKKED